MSIREYFSRKNLPLILSVIVTLSVVFGIGLFVGYEKAPAIYKITEVTNKEAASSTVDFSPFWEAWNVINEKYVPTHSTSTASDQERVYGAISGMTQSLGDPYTVFFPPVEAKMFASEIKGNFEGIGMEIGEREGKLVAISPLKGSPSEKAGMKVGDIILKINGKSTTGLTVEAAVQQIRGPKGTVVTLTVSRAGVKDPIDVPITRDVINIPTLNSYTRPDGIFVIQLYNFSEASFALFGNAIQEFAKSGGDKLIIDLRGNPGGYLEAAVDMASWFLPAGKVVVTERPKDPKGEKIYRSKGYGVAGPNLHVMILVNGGSASASEILSGALREQGIAKLVGEKTFGKGSVQELVQLTTDTSLKVTVARWFTPNGNSISENGLTPDYVVKMTEADVKAGRDPQMDKAVEILKQFPTFTVVNQ